MNAECAEAVARAVQVLTTCAEKRAPLHAEYSALRGGVLKARENIKTLKVWIETAENGLRDAKEQLAATTVRHDDMYTAIKVVEVELKAAVQASDMIRSFQGTATTMYPPTETTTTTMYPPTETTTTTMYPPTETTTGEVQTHVSAPPQLESVESGESESITRPDTYWFSNVASPTHGMTSNLSITISEIVQRSKSVYDEKKTLFLALGGLMETRMPEKERITIIFFKARGRRLPTRCHLCADEINGYCAPYRNTKGEKAPLVHFECVAALMSLKPSE